MNKFTMFLCLFMFSMVTSSPTNRYEKKVYIINMGALPSNTDYDTIIHRHYSLLSSVTGKSYNPNLIVTNFGKSFDGFVAWLTEEESTKLSALPDVVSVFPNTDVGVIEAGVVDSGLKTQHLAPL